MFFVYIFIVSAYIFAVNYYKEFLIKVLDIGRSDFVFFAVFSSIFLPITVIGGTPVLLAKYLRSRKNGTL